MRKYIILLFFIIQNIIIFSQISDFSEIPISYPEVWDIDGTLYQIPQTVITGGSLFTVHAIVDHEPTMDSFNRQIAIDLVEYAVLNGYLENAQLFNKYSQNFHIRDDIVGVALIYINNPDTGQISGSRFAISLEDIFNENPIVNSISPPESFKISERQELILQLENIISSRYFDRIFDLYSEKALDDFDVDEARQRIRVMWSLAKEINLMADDFLIYIGNRSGVRGFEYYIPIEIVPVDDDSITINAFIKILIIDEEPDYGIYNIELNFSDNNSMRQLYGDDLRAEFLVPSN